MLAYGRLVYILLLAELQRRTRPGDDGDVDGGHPRNVLRSVG